MKIRGWMLMIVVLALMGCSGGQQATVPITTSSEEARESFLKGQELFEALQIEEARSHFDRAVELDPGFAMAYLYLARIAPDREFNAAVRRAVDQLKGVSFGERDFVMVENARAAGRPEEQLRLGWKLVSAYPDDERAWTELGRTQLEQEAYAAAVKSLGRARKLNPAFAPALDLIGRAHWHRDEFEEAEAAFEKVIDLLPDRPEPLAARGGVLMKVGTFDAAVASFDKALAIDSHLAAAQVGLANALIFQGRADEARRRLAGFHEKAQNDDERRRALLWSALSHVHEDDHANALTELDRSLAVARQGNDARAASQDLMIKGHVLCDAGDLDGALAAYAEALRTLELSDAPASVKAAAVVEHRFREFLVALAREDRWATRKKNLEFRAAMQRSRTDADVLLSNEVRGLLERLQGNYTEALRRLTTADSDNPRVLYVTALVHVEAGNADRARRFAEMAANFNAPHVEYAFVRNKALRLLAEN